MRRITLSVVNNVCTDIIIKNISFDNIYDVSATLAQCWKSAYKGLVNDDYLSSLKNTHWVEYLKKGINDKQIDCIVAERGNRIIGVSVFGKSITEQYPTDGELISLYIIPEFIGQNIGHLLLEKAQKSIKEQKYANCIVCAFAENNRAIKFYQSHGFKVVFQDEKIKMGEQELKFVIMRKKL